MADVKRVLVTTAAIVVPIVVLGYTLYRQADNLREATYELNGRKYGEAVE